ncbi:hypothetical protein B0I35DRAFT_411727 [Stachybotrys elegans]|uniref:Ysc84 actin-binding domain-containing protein n=1 Tax=Stachybotrys elegans TaxID=80388 RepID=A0A8K0WN61_9HYPO|nr:hypothetical protein B0I35DRAFT_411727 [Stachybotrys elegans]
MGGYKGTELEKDCDKATKIIQAFIEHGKISQQVIQNARGIAVFTGFRAGMYFAGSGGSGVVLARLADGTWSPPSAFSVRSGGVGLVYGVDFYDCVCVLNTPEAVEAYTNPELELGGSVSLAAGPIGGNVGGAKDVKPVWTYTRSKGIYGGLTVDGTVIKEKASENAEFYGPGFSTAQILHGEVKLQEGEKWLAVRRLLDTLQ